MGVWLIVPAVIILKYFLLAIFWGKKKISLSTIHVSGSSPLTLEQLTLGLDMQ